MNHKFTKNIILAFIAIFSIPGFAEPKEEFSILAFGDIANCQDDKEQGVKTVHSIVKKEKFDFMIHLGDLVYPDGTEKELKKCYGKYFKEYKSKIFPIPGNHEYNADKGEPYFQYFKSNIDLIKKQKNHDLHDHHGYFPKYYSFDKNGWTFIFLDSNLKKEEREKQLVWFEKKLKDKQKCSIISVHHPLITDGIRPIKNNAKELEPLFNKYSPTIVLNGHDHHFQESNKINNTKHFLVGTGGTTISNMVSPFGKAKNLSFEYGVLKLTLKENSYTYSFLTEKNEQFKNTESCSN